MTARQYVIPTGPGLGRGLVNHDEKSKAFRAVDLLPPTAKPRTRHWRRMAAFDQGQTPECVGYTGKGLLNSRPFYHDVPYARRAAYSPDEFYHGAQANDQWAGEAYEGTSALGLGKYLLKRGLITAYSWCFGVQETLLTVSNLGPVGIGIGWRAGMDNPDADGVIHYSGSFRGGHEIEVSGFDVKRQAFELFNSWGPNWGLNGRAWLPVPDMDAALQDDGDVILLHTGA